MAEVVIGQRFSKTNIQKKHPINRDIALQELDNNSTVAFSATVELFYFGLTK
jgi:hypothetical protein